MRPIDMVATSTWGIERHEKGGIRAASLMDIMHRNVARWRRLEKPEWELLDIASNFEEAQELVRLLKQSRKG
jgi:hypothetical protein